MVECKTAEITLGASICEKIKHIYYPVPWSMEVAREVAAKLTKVKAAAKLYFPEASEVDRLREVFKFSTDDIKDILDAE